MENEPHAAPSRELLEYRLGQLEAEVKRLRDNGGGAGVFKFVIKSWQTPILVLALVWLAATFGVDPETLKAILGIVK